MEVAESKEKEALKRNYGKIVMTLENATLPSEKLETHTVSQKDGLSPEIEVDLRILGCELIQTAGILLKLPSVSNNHDHRWQIDDSSEIFARHVCIFHWASLPMTMMLNIYNRSENPVELMFNDQLSVIVLGRYGIRSGAVPTFFLLEVLCSSWHGSNRDGLHLPRVQNRGSPATTKRRVERFQPHQADPSLKVSNTPQIQFLISTQFINLFINQFCR